MDELHSTQCEPEGLNISINWCTGDQRYRVLAQFHHWGQLWEDEAEPVLVAETSDIEDLQLLVRAQIIAFKPQINGSRLRSYGLRGRWRPSRRPAPGFDPN